MSPPPGSGDPDDPSDAAGQRTNPLGGTLWLTQTPSLSLWRGEVGLRDWLRIEAREGGLLELPLTPPGPLRVGRLKTGMPEPPHLASELFVSSQAALLRHDGVRWWLRRRPECHERVPTVVGARVLGPDEEQPLVHGTFVQVGRARGTLVDRRYAVPAVPSGAVDPLTGLLGRVGLEQEIAGRVSLNKHGALLVFAAPTALVSGDPASPWIRAVLALHAHWPRVPILHEQGVVALLVGDDAGPVDELAAQGQQVVAAAGVRGFVSGHWPLGSDDAVRELELALYAAQSGLAAGSTHAPLSLRSGLSAGRLSTPDAIRQALAAERRRPVVLFALEETGALARIGPHVVPALDQELASVVLSLAPPRALVARMTPGVIAACLPLHVEVDAFAADVQRQWQARPPVVDGQIELPRALCWESVLGDPAARALDLAREGADPQGALQALSSGLPYPIAGRLLLASTAGSAVERVKLLFDVLEGAWRLVAALLAAAYFSPRPGDAAPLPDDLIVFARASATRHAYPLGKWRELARLMARELAPQQDVLGQLARELLRVRQGDETLEALANQLHPLRNQFAHNVYPEARAQRDLPAFEQATREFLRALRPLTSWTLVTVEKSDPDLYADTQMVEYIDHTGAAEGGARRRVGFKSAVRLAHVVYLTRWRDGLVLPLEPFLRRRPRGNSFDLFWAQHLPRPGATSFAAVVDGDEIVSDIDERRLPPRLRELLAAAQRPAG